MKKLPTVLIVAAMALALDLASKQVVRSSFQVNEEIVLIKNLFSLSYHQNRGVAFGALSDLSEAYRVPILAVLACSVMLFLIQLMRKSTNKLELIALAAVFGGALGNLINRTWLGYVVDFLHLHWKDAYHFPTFNIADIFISVGVALMLLSSFRSDIASRARKQC